MRQVKKYIIESTGSLVWNKSTPDFPIAFFRQSWNKSPRKLRTLPYLRGFRNANCGKQIGIPLPL